MDPVGNLADPLLASQLTRAYTPIYAPDTGKRQRANKKTTLAKQ